MSEKMKPCPLCGGELRHAHAEKSLGCDTCDVWINYGGFNNARTFEQAVDVWNRRMPEPGTSVIRWKHYDGTPETLPRKHITVFLIRSGMEEIIFSRLDSDGDWMERQIAYDKHFGDLWAYLPVPPEGM